MGVALSLVSWGGQDWKSTTEVLLWAYKLGGPEAGESITEEDLVLLELEM